MADGIDQTRSPPRRAATRDRERRNPSITPRKFQRFFTPRSRVPSRPSAARRALLELTAPALNRSQTPSSPLKSIGEHGQFTEANSSFGHGPVKRRKIELSADLSPAGLPFPSCLPSPLPHSLQIDRTATVETGLLSPIQSLPSTQSTEAVAESEADYEDAEELVEASRPLRRILTLSHRDLAAHVVQREAGYSSRTLQCNSALPVGGMAVFVRICVFSSADSWSQITDRRLPTFIAALLMSIHAPVWKEDGGRSLSVRRVATVSERCQRQNSIAVLWLTKV
jgi:hypothetical protein